MWGTQRRAFFLDAKRGTISTGGWNGGSQGQQGSVSVKSPMKQSRVRRMFLSCSTANRRAISIMKNAFEGGLSFVRSPPQELTKPGGRT